MRKIKASVNNPQSRQEEVVVPVKRREIAGRSAAKFIPLDAPGMPPPGPNFLRHAQQLGDRSEVTSSKKTGTVVTVGPLLNSLYARALREPLFRMPIQIRPGKSEVVEFMPGHIWGQHAKDYAAYCRHDAGSYRDVDGPHPADVMVVAKGVTYNDLSERRLFMSQSGGVLIKALRDIGLGRDIPNWYVTNVLKFLPPDNETRIKSDWLKDCLPLLHQEFRIVRPKYILCLGADAVRTVMGKGYSVDNTAGRVMQLSIDVTEDENQPESIVCDVMCVLSPGELVHSPLKERDLQSGLVRFKSLIQGERFDVRESQVDHRVIDNYEDAVAWANEAHEALSKLPVKDRLVAWDAEWQGEHPHSPGAYVRTLQASWADRAAVCFKLTHQGGKTAFRDRDGRPAIKRLYRLLEKFCAGKRAVGHFFVSDLEHLIYNGFNPIKYNKIPKVTEDGVTPWTMMKHGAGWIDTAMAMHAIEETAKFGLEHLTNRFTTAPRYDIALSEWKKKVCAERNIKAAALEGYGECPDNVLMPYALYDADVTRRIAVELLKLLDRDHDGFDCWESFWESMSAQSVILEMHQTGIVVDRKRIDELTLSFMQAKSLQEEVLKDWAQWPEFNIRSVHEVREFLYGVGYSGKFDKETGKAVRVSPETARLLGVPPILDTSKPPKVWSELVDRGKADSATPGTGKLILGILARDNLEQADQINNIRDYRFLDQVLKSVLRPPTEEDGYFLTDDDGFFVYDKGLASSIDQDGRVRTHISPTAETGRWKSSRPNLTNISKSRDKDYKRLLKDGYKHKLRSVLMASPGHALIEFDLRGAELFMMAIMSGDEKLIDHCRRAELPESDPNHWDTHSNIAKLAFRLECEAKKSVLEELGLLHMRNLAKAVIFGIAYGRGAKAVALQAREQGVQVTVEEAQAVIDAIYEMYPRLQSFFDEAMERARAGTMQSCFGRRRRFGRSEFVADHVLGEFERQAKNFPIQGGVSSLVTRGLVQLQYQRDEVLQRPDLFRMLLQIHDAGLIEAPYEYVDYLTKPGGLIEHAMVHSVPVFPTTLTGTPLGTGPYYCSLDIEVEPRWGEKYTLEECKLYGIPERFAAKF